MAAFDYFPQPFCFAAAPVLLIAAACTPDGGEPPITPIQQSETARHPVSGLAIIPVTVVTASGRIEFATELADTTDAQAQGMMFRTEMGDDEAMIFPSAAPGTRSFWMKNTPLPLDIIFIGPDGRITNIEAGVPYSLESVSSDGPAVAVFEIRGGLSEERGIAVGDRVEFTFPE